MAEATGTGCVRSHAALAEYFEDLGNFSNAGLNSKGVYAYLGWHFAFAGFRVALLLTDYVSLCGLIVYSHWDFEITAWDFEHSGACH